MSGCTGNFSGKGLWLGAFQPRCRNSGREIDFYGPSKLFTARLPSSLLIHSPSRAPVHGRPCVDMQSRSGTPDQTKTTKTNRGPELASCFPNFSASLFGNLFEPDIKTKHSRTHLPVWVCVRHVFPAKQTPFHALSNEIYHV